MSTSHFDPDLFRRSFAVATIIGILCRGLVLRVSDGQYPSRPQDFLEQIIVSGLAGALGAVAIPALIDKEYSALTFFAVAIQQFQGLSDQERITLKNIDEVEVVPKGPSYVEEISSTYESRSYISLFSSLAASGAFLFMDGFYDANIWICSIAAIVLGALVGFIFQKALKRDSIGDLADIKEAKISFDGPILKVNNVVIDNIGLENTRKTYMSDVVSFEIVPKKKGDFGIINDSGQMDAIIHNLYIHMGLKKDYDDVDLLTIIKPDLVSKRVILIYIPLKKDIKEMKSVIESVPILEASKGKQSGYSKSI